MPYLSYDRIRHDGQSRYAKEVSAKVKELVDHYGIQRADQFREMMNRWLNEMPRRNQFHITDRYKVVQTGHRVHVLRRKDVFSTDFLHIFEIIEHPDNQ
jgi:hypothetical protein